MSKYKPTTPAADFPAIENEIQKFWEENKTFQKSIDLRDGAEDFVFYDGPPGPNGLPHHGHVGVSAMKDAICRYQTMRGKQVKRNFGWDTHGLPIEIEVCKTHNLKDTQAILDLGIEKFNELCRTDVMKYSDAWVKTLKRVGRWGDYENDYSTMDISYMESVISIIKRLNEKGLLYKGYKVMAYSYGAETVLSNAEAKSEYKDVTDQAVTVLFKLKNTDVETYIMAWTTTPWTLPSNLALALGKNIDYAVMERDGKQYVLADALVEKYAKQLEGATKVKTIKGAELVMHEYEPMFPYFKDRSEHGAFRVYHGDFVTTGDGTGIVHIAPYGEDDSVLLEQNEIPMVTPVNGQGKFDETVPDYEGQLVFEANKNIMRDLKDRGILVKQESYLHPYPHCPRTKTPLIYRPTDSWFVNVQKIKKEVLDNNQKVNWVPEHFKNGRFGKWLENAHDWSISRNRFWGCPLPIWESDDPKYPHMEVLGSIAEIEEKSGMKVDNLHLPYIDEVTYPNPMDPTGQSKMRRVPEVLDCWFEAGSMPYASVGHVFGRDDESKLRFPADFIVEGQDQTRGWFYGMIILGTALMGESAYKTCMSNGMMLDEKKKKLSKSERNYTEPEEIFNTVGADSFRWFVLNSPFFNAESISIDAKGELIKKGMREAIIPLWNAYHFFTLYANADNVDAKEDWTSSNTLDQYILAKLNTVIETATESMDTYKVDNTCVAVSDFLEVLNNWYIRRSRERFWGTNVSSDEQMAAFNTLYTVLTTLTKLIAPMMPMIAEYIYQNLTGEASVHLTDYPTVQQLNSAEGLVSAMDAVQNICSTGKSVREDNRLRNRLPLSSVTIAGGSELSDELKEIIKDELNVKEVKFAENLNEYADKFLYLLTPVIGQRLGGKLKDIIPASKKGEYEVSGENLLIAGETLLPSEFEERLTIKDGLTGKAALNNTAVVILDTELTPELKREGIARDMIRAIQDERKAIDLNVSDRINITVATESEEVKTALETWGDMIKTQTLADSITMGSGKTTVTIEDDTISFEVKKA